MAKPEKNSRGEYDKFTSLGCYPLFYLTRDNGVICPDCMNGKNGSEAKVGHEDAQWDVTDGDVNWEDPGMYCDHCYARVESAYAEPEGRE